MNHDKSTVSSAATFNDSFSRSNRNGSELGSSHLGSFVFASNESVGKTGPKTSGAARARPKTVGGVKRGKNRLRNIKTASGQRRRRVSKYTVVRGKKNARPKTDYKKKRFSKDYIAARPLTVATTTPPVHTGGVLGGSGVLARDRSAFLKLRKADRAINRELSVREKKSGSKVMELLQAEAEKSVRHGNVRRVFFNKLRMHLGNQSLAFKQKYKTVLCLEVLSDEPRNHFEIVERKLILEAAKIVEGIDQNTWTLASWKLMLTVSVAINNIIQEGSNNDMALARQRAVSVLVRTAGADLFKPGKNAENDPDSELYLPKWKGEGPKVSQGNGEGETKEECRVEDSPLLARYIDRAQFVAFQALECLAKRKQFRGALVKARVLEVALLAMGGRNRQLETLRDLRLTEGVPTFEGAPAQIAAKNLVSHFDTKDYNLMSRLQQSRDVRDKCAAADERLAQLLLPSPVKADPKRPSTAPINLGAPFFNPSVITRTPRHGGIKVMKASQLHIVRGEVSGAKALPTWTPLEDLLKRPDIRAKMHRCAEEEFEFSKLVEERRLKKEYVMIRAQEENRKYEEKKQILTRMEMIKYRCSPEGVMEDIMRRNGLLKQPSWMSGSRKKLAKGLNAKPKQKLLRKVFIEESEPSIYSPDSSWCFEFNPPEHPGESPFGRCATDGRAWWENFLIKKQRPSRLELADIPVDVEADIEPLLLVPLEQQVRNYSATHPNPDGLHIPRLQPVSTRSRVRPVTAPAKEGNKSRSKLSESSGKKSKSLPRQANLQRPATTSKVRRKRRQKD